jgi:RNA recognition motif-containing protein
MKIYVGNIDFQASEDQLNDLFAGYGEVTSVKIVMDKFTGRSKGFAFVEMENDSEGLAAVEGLNGHQLKARELRVSEARPKEEGSGGGGGYKKSYGGGGNRGGGDRGGYNRNY